MPNTLDTSEGERPLATQALGSFMVTHGAMLKDGIAIANSVPRGTQSLLMRRLLVVAVAASWEAFHEDLCREARESRVGLANGVGAIQRFHNPTSRNIDRLYRDVLGVGRITDSWGTADPARGMTTDECRAGVDKLMRFRHDTAHGVFELSPTGDECAEFLSTVLYLAIRTDEHVGRLIATGDPQDLH